MLKNKKLTVYSYPEHYVVDGPKTRTSTFLDVMLEKNFDLDTLPVGVYEFTVRYKFPKFYSRLRKID